MAKEFFTADTHFLHKNIISSCPRRFTSVEEMNDDIITRWNSVVGAGDTVYHIGDFGIGNAIKMAEIRSQLSGKIVLVLGDQDYQFTKKKWLEVVGVNEVHDALEWKDCLLYHLPHYEDCAAEDRYRTRRMKPVDDKWLICGHVHDLWRIKGKQFNVGIDVNNYYPVLASQVLQEMKENDHGVSLYSSYFN